MYVIVYLNAVMLGYGLFESLEAVEKWKDTHVLTNHDFYEGKYIHINRKNTRSVFLPDGVDFKYANLR